MEPIVADGTMSTRVCALAGLASTWTATITTAISRVMPSGFILLIDVVDIRLTCQSPSAITVHMWHGECGRATNRWKRRDFAWDRAGALDMARSFIAPS